MTDEFTDQTTATVSAPIKAKRAPTAKRLTANEMAAQLSKRFGVTVTAKSVRQWCRENVSAYGDDRYTVHAYDAAVAKRITVAWAQRTARRTASRNGDKV